MGPCLQGRYQAAFNVFTAESAGPLLRLANYLRASPDNDWAGEGLEQVAQNVEALADRAEAEAKRLGKKAGKVKGERGERACGCTCVLCGDVGLCKPGSVPLCPCLSPTGRPPPVSHQLMNELWAGWLQSRAVFLVLIPHCIALTTQPMHSHSRHALIPLPAHCGPISPPHPRPDPARPISPLSPAPSSLRPHFSSTSPAPLPHCAGARAVRQPAAKHHGGLRHAGHCAPAGQAARCDCHRLQHHQGVA